MSWDPALKREFTHLYGMTEEEWTRLWDAHLKGDLVEAEAVCAELVERWVH